MSFNVKHNKNFRKFYVNVGGREAFLKYEKPGEGVLNFKILFVPKNLRGLGVAEKILKSAIGFAEKNQFQVRSTCNYVSNFFESHSEFKNLKSDKSDVLTWVLHYN